MEPSTDGPFSDRERAAAENFARAARDARVARVVYLGGPIPAGGVASAHLASRLAVERILLGAGTLLLMRSREVTLFGHRWLLFDVGGAVGIAGFLLTFLVAAWRNGVALYREERLPLTEPTRRPSQEIGVQEKTLS